MTYVVLGLILAAGVIAFVWLLRSRSEEAPAGGAVAASAPAAAAPAPKPTPKPAPAEDSRPAGPATESEDDEAEFTFVARRPADLAAALEAEANMESLEIDLSTAEEPPEDETGPVDRILVSAHGNSDQGRRREHNEDAYLILNGELFSIADGMGGYAAGEVASQMAVDTLTACWESGHYGDFEEDPKLPKLGDQLVRAIKSANRAIFDEASRDEAKRGMGTTIIAALFSPRKQRAYLAHVGDSRIYRYRGGKLEQLTQDHTLGALLGVSGRRGAQLTRALGIAPDVDVDLFVETPEPSDIYLLCSDGLSKMVPHDELEAMMADAPEDLDGHVEKLIAEANARGGKDNVSVILVRVADMA
ncbi:MAG: serine/threonine-protein phosphatase [Sandaracinus sp.]|nr:serine/threonine-protein phosphatase [Sandaracinus sp.]MCB9612600.1 serine/threonine-protein phosphatase [Sandaracinus sp.]MCB9622779.1 serine/threonine-protein phosphatase [Sandaracinus sp.]